MSVSAAATLPPVQDSAVASLRPLGRRAVSTWSAIAASAGSDKTEPHQQQKREPGIERRDNIVEHDAEPAMDGAIGPACRKRLDDVGDAEQHEAGAIGEKIGGRDGEDEPMRGDPLDHDEAGGADAPRPAGHSPSPAARGQKRRTPEGGARPAPAPRP